MPRTLSPRRFRRAGRLRPLPLAAAPLTRQCDYKGEGKLGPWSSPMTNLPAWSGSPRPTAACGAIRTARSAASARQSPPPTIRARSSSSSPLKAGKVEVGFRWPDDGTTGHLAYFDLLCSRTRRSAASGARFGTSRRGKRLPVSLQPALFTREAAERLEILRLGESAGFAGLPEVFEIIRARNRAISPSPLFSAA